MEPALWMPLPMMPVHRDVSSPKPIEIRDEELGILHSQA